MKTFVILFRKLDAISVAVFDAVDRSIAGRNKDS